MSAVAFEEFVLRRIILLRKNGPSSKVDIYTTLSPSQGSMYQLQRDILVPRIDWSHTLRGTYLYLDTMPWARHQPDLYLNVFLSEKIRIRSREGPVRYFIRSATNSTSLLISFISSVNAEFGKKCDGPHHTVVNE